MPRLPRSLIKQAYATDKLLPLLLRPCRDLDSAKNELRWLREFSEDTAEAVQRGRGQRRLHDLCVRRARGEPLQYLLGSQPFGDLDIRCRTGVLIPRPDTESYVTHLASMLARDRERFPHHSLRVLDLCTGTGCIALLMYALLRSHFAAVRARGVDLSPRALALARDNLRHNVALRHLPERALQDIEFSRADVLRDFDSDDDDDIGAGAGFDVVVSNPPYVSPASFDRQTEASVRRFEPRSALVPDLERGNGFQDRGTDGDIFYDRLMAIGERAGARVLVMEVEDAAQAERVFAAPALSGHRSYWRPRAMWRDSVGWDERASMVAIKTVVAGHEIRIEGSGHVRAVLLEGGGR